ncbi:MAG: phage head-tail connector protein, partial [Phycisphaeraceae bacterium]|nr:phage head-tail connector protein [Phycisphaeraceae bacterium]
MRQLLAHAEAYEVLEPPEAPLLTIDELQAQLRIDVVDEAPLLESYIAAATELLERDTKRLLRPCTLRLHLDRFPCGGAIELRR